MTPQQARTYAGRIIQTWSGGPTLDVWIEELEPLHDGTVGATFVRLRRELDRAPSVARFLSTYRSLDTAPKREVVECAVCDGTGYRQALPLIEGEGEYVLTYTQVVPCEACPAGRDAMKSYTTTARVNGFEPVVRERAGPLP